MISLKEFIDTLELESVVMGDRDELELETSDVNRPGLQLSGFFDYFASDRLQVVGKAVGSGEIGHRRVFVADFNVYLRKSETWFHGMPPVF